MTTGKMLFLHIILLLMPLGASASTATEPLSADSDGVLRAQLVVVSPGDRLYQSLGHCALRLVSEEHQLDYCFTFEADADGTVADHVRFFVGRCQARWVAVPTAQYTADYSREQRSLTAYALPLADDQIRHLWQRLDEAVTSRRTLPFNFIDSNCAQGVAQMLEPYITLHEPQWMGAMDNGRLARHALSHAPWMQFLVVTLMGTEADGHWTPLRRTTPGLLPLAPAPLLMTALCRLSPRRDRPSVMTTTRRAFTVYTLALAAFIAATPLSSQLDLAHQLATAALAVRSLSYSRFICSPNTFST